MQYAKMIDLIEKAKNEGSEQKEYISQLLAQQFERWIGNQHLGNLTEEEEDVLRDTFEKGYESTLTE